MFIVGIKERHGILREREREISPRPIFSSKTQSVSFSSNSAAPEGEKLASVPLAPQPRAAPLLTFMQTKTHCFPNFITSARGWAHSLRLPSRWETQCDLPSFPFTLTLSSWNETPVAGSPLPTVKGNWQTGDFCVWKKTGLKETVWLCNNPSGSMDVVLRL